MKPRTDIIAAALDAALSPRPLNYTAAGLAATVVAALDAEGYSILPVVLDGAIVLPIAGWADIDPEGEG